MGLDPTLALGDRTEHLRHPVTDVIPYDVAHEEEGEQDTYGGEDQVEVAMILNMLEDEALDMMDDELQESRHQSHRHPDKETEDEDEVALTDVSLSPVDEAIQQGGKGLAEYRHPTGGSSVRGRGGDLGTEDFDFARRSELDDLRGFAGRLILSAVADYVVDTRDDLGADAREEERRRLATDIS